MYHRTNKTLSALSHTTRHIVVTRPFAANVRVNHGDLTLVVRHSLRDLMRDGMQWNDQIPQWGSTIPSIPGSFSCVSERSPSCVTRPRDFVVVGARVAAEPRPARLVGRLEPCASDLGLSGPTVCSTAWSSTAASTTALRSRLGAKSAPKPGVKRTARRAAKAAATQATASGK
jgi:hypothetical protein